MTYCTHCGEEAVPDDRFCIRCGAVIGNGDSPAPPTSLASAGECEACGRSLSLAWRFCGDCGTATNAAATTRSTRVDDIDEWISADSPEVLTPEVVTEPGIELISRTAGAAVPPDAPLPPANEATPLAPQPSLPVPDDDGDEDVWVEPMPPSQEQEEPVAAGAPELPPVAMEREEPPVSIYSRERLRSGRHAGVDPALIPPARQVEAPPGSASRTTPAASSLPAVIEPAVPAVVDVRAAGAAPEPTLFRDPSRAGALSRFALVALAAIATVTALALQILNNRIGRLGTTNGSVTSVETAHAMVNDRLRPTLLAVGVLTLVALIRWTYRSYHNVRSFGKEDLRFGSAAAVWAWLIPGVNLVVPPLLMNDAWRAADVYARDDIRWRRRKGNGWTWIAFVALTISIAAAALSLVPSRATLQGAIDANRYLIGAAGALVMAAVAMARAVSAITRRQQSRLALTSPGTST